MNEIINTGGTVSNSSLTVLTLKHEYLISMILNQDQETGGGSPTSAGGIVYNNYLRNLQCIWKTRLHIFIDQYTYRCCKLFVKLSWPELF